MYIFLKISKYEYSLDTVKNSLPANSPDGYSMQDLCVTGNKLGLDLAGVKITDDAFVFEEPSIVLLKGGKNGYYVVVRPIGRSGKLIQIIDPAGSIEVVEWRALRKSSYWTGLALMPRRAIRFQTRVIMIASIYINYIIRNCFGKLAI